jgi:NAD(P)-dependent dehydrogenase (short-subunit alcohol dehydrogenase family)
MTADYGDRFRLDGKTAIVPGASHGIGLACARRLARNGSEVLLVGRTAKTLEEARSDLQAEGLKVRSVVCDVTDRDALPSMINTLPQLDILVNNAGGNRPTPFLEVTREDFDWLIDLNVRSLFLRARQRYARWSSSATKVQSSTCLLKADT